MNVFASRLTELRRLMAAKEIDTVLVLAEENRRYLSGFTGEDHQFDESSGALLISDQHQFLATDSRFDLQARDEAPLYEVFIYRKGLAKSLSDLTQRLNSRRLGFESVRVSVKQHNEYRKELEANHSPVELVPLDGVVESLREVKTADEIDKTQRALAVAEKVYRQVAKGLKPGLTEKAIAWQMEMGLRQEGADGSCFPIIVAGGPNSALPHAIPTDREIKSGEPILFDWGAKLDGYCSDTSRTVILGSPDDTFHKVHGTVLEAQRRAIAAIADGASSTAIDAKARNYINEQGFEGKFGHGLGHGTGLAVHEAPRLSPIKDEPLKKGMLVTVEPGIYLPEWGGVRIENQVVVESSGSMVLNRLSTTYDIEKI